MPVELKVVKMPKWLKQGFNVLPNTAKRSAMEQGGQVGVKLIRERTLSGKDANDKTFKAYSPAYRKFKQSKGRGSKPNLSFTSNMLSSVQVRSATFKQAILGVRSNEQKKALAHQRGDRVPQRKWFGFSRKDRKEWFKEMGEIVIKQVRRKMGA